MIYTKTNHSYDKAYQIIPNHWKDFLWLFWNILRNPRKFVIITEVSSEKEFAIKNITKE